MREIADALELASGTVASRLRRAREHFQQGWGCTDDCGGGECVPDASGCDASQNPVGFGCPSGEVCDTAAGGAPSSCSCDAESGSWVCTEDCGGGVCAPEPPICALPNPAGCSQGGCPSDEVCDTTVGCYPSSCTCEPSGMWVCTEDCGGGHCVEQSPCGPSPAGCIQLGCPDGYTCDTTVRALIGREAGREPPDQCQAPATSTG